MTAPTLKAPFPWFGGKSRVSHLVWERFGEIKNYVEPFAGSLAVLLGRPDWNPGMTETVNDKDALLCNFWRAVCADPEKVAHYTNWPVIESDLSARNYELALSRGEIRERLEGDSSWHDPMLAGWWVWGIGLWIGAEFATLCGPWARTEDGRLVKQKPGEGTKRQRPELGACKGVFRKRPELGAWREGQPVERGVHGVDRQRPALGTPGCGVQKRLPHLSSGGQGVHRDPHLEGLIEWFGDLSHRLRRVRVCSGDWKRVLGPSVTTKHGMTGLFLDPPYEAEGRDTRCYNHDGNVWEEVWPWCLKHGQNKLLRIALCGYEGDVGAKLVAAGWREVAWKAQGGYGAGRSGRGEANSERERIWFSPNCLLPAEQLDLFEEVGV